MLLVVVCLLLQGAFSSTIKKPENSNYISLTVGNIWLASVWSARKSVWLIVDKKWDRSIGSTLRYIPLGWKIAPWHTLSQINASEQIWESYAVAAVKVLASPMSRLIIPKNLLNKERPCDVTVYSPAEVDSPTQAL